MNLDEIVAILQQTGMEKLWDKDGENFSYKDDHKLRIVLLDCTKTEAISPWNKLEEKPEYICQYAIQYDGQNIMIIFMRQIDYIYSAIANNQNKIGKIGYNVGFLVSSVPDATYENHLRKLKLHL